MLFNKQTTTQTVNAAKKAVKCYSYKELYKPLAPDDYGTDVHNSLIDKGYKLVADTGTVRSYSGVPGYEYVVLFEHANTSYLICCETTLAYISWMRRFSMIPHLIEKFLPQQNILTR